jgi:hypothetical protein
VKYPGFHSSVAKLADTVVVLELEEDVVLEDEVVVLDVVVGIVVVELIEVVGLVVVVRLVEVVGDDDELVVELVVPGTLVVVAVVEETEVVADVDVVATEVVLDVDTTVVVVAGPQPGAVGFEHLPQPDAAVSPMTAAQRTNTPQVERSAADRDINKGPGRMIYRTPVHLTPPLSRGACIIGARWVSVARP